MKGLAIKPMEYAPKALTFREKTDLLRCYEGYAYQVAHYLLQSEAGARQAAEQTLLELYSCAEFFLTSDEARREKVKKTALRQALAFRSRQMPRHA